jgi:ABC-type Na+ transport system ATPase subunit NatA
VADPLTIETSTLRKTYDGVDALRGLDLRVPTGSIFGFLGRNGAGKTTTIKLLLGMARPTAGVARVFGLPCDAPDASVEIRRRVGFVSDDKELYGGLTVDELIGFTASFFPRWRKDLEQQYLRSFALPRERKVKALSRGTRTKLALLLALCRDADLLILDEPTSGLDPAMAEEVLQILVTQMAERQLPSRSAGVRRRRAGCAVPHAGNYARHSSGPRAQRPDQHRRRADRRRSAPVESAIDRCRRRHVERHLSRNRHRGELTCSGTNPGSIRADVS